MPKKDVIKLRHAGNPPNDHAGPHVIEDQELSFLRSVMVTKRPYGKFRGTDGMFIYCVSNTTGEPDLESFYVGQEKKAEEWLNNHV
jgi:hypothetical protein